MFKILYIMIKWIIFIFWFNWNYTSINCNQFYAKKLKNYLENLGILGIKLGQYLCNRQDICSDIMKRELEVFLSNNTIHSIEHTNTILKDAKITDIEVGEVIGSGSLCQVYLCHKKNTSISEKLVLKINHPETKNLKNEIMALRRIIGIMSYIKKYNFVLNIDWNAFFNMIEDQIDMRNEARYLQKYYSIYYKDDIQKVKEISVPRFIEGNENYILMTYCEGKPLNYIDRTSNIYKKAHVLFSSSSIHTFFIHRIMHGDIHEGNVLVQDNGNISIIDFGICIELDKDDYKGIFAAARFDNNPSEENCYKFVSTVVKPLDINNKKFDIEEINSMIYRDYMEIHRKYTAHPSMGDLFNVILILIRKYKLLIRGEILAYFMNSVLLEGLCPINERTNLGSYLAVNYMMKDKFFAEECDIILDDFNSEIIKKIPNDLQEKYRNIKYNI
jgi:predicted unusual protein kinase regulating ubiquinone biosynthesis (AarF/ABC1/UbiB family)